MTALACSAPRKRKTDCASWLRESNGDCRVNGVAAALQDKVSIWCTEVDDLKRQLHEAIEAKEFADENRPFQQSQIDLFRADAERYRYLRDHCAMQWTSRMGGPDTVSIDFGGNGRDLDAAVDVAKAGAA